MWRGLYYPAIFATILVIVALEAVGFFEKRTNLKVYSRVYEIRGQDATALEQTILRAMDSENRRLGELEHDCVGGIQRFSFSVLATNRDTPEDQRTAAGWRVRASGIDV